MRGQYPSKIAYGLWFASAILVAFVEADEGSEENSTLPTDFFKELEECDDCRHEKYLDNITRFDCSMAKDDRVG